MKTTLIAATLISVLVCNNASATTYAITSNTTWTAVVGSGSCWTCTFNITPGITFTMDYAGTCGTCTFNDGDMTITQNLTCQTCTFNTDTITMSNLTLNLQSSTTNFTNTVFNISGSSELLSTAGIAITNSTFAFSGGSYFNNNGGSFTASNSSLTFAGSSYFTSTSGPMVLENNSSLVAGDGTLASTAYIYMNTSSPVNIYDNSMIKLNNYNNYYFNWSAYNSISNGQTYSTASNSLNCGGAYPHSCAAPYLYGCATLNFAGALACTTLAVTGTTLSAALSGDHSVELSWSAGQSANPDHFVVQRSTDAQAWQTIGTVAAQASTDLADNYHFNDPAAPGGSNSYRLQVVDENGATAWSTIATVKIAATATGGFSIYPNPITGQSFVLRTSSTDPVLVRIFTLSGQLLSIVSLKGQTQYPVELTSAAPHNSYIVIQVIGGTGSEAFTTLNQ